MQLDEVIARLESLADPDCVRDMAGFGINPDNALGISMTDIMNLAKEIGKDHDLAQELWDSGIHEAKILACEIDEPEKVSEAQLEKWVTGLDSWDICDECCLKLFDKLPFTYERAAEWSKREEEFVRRAGFVLMTVLAVHDKKAPDEKFLPFLTLIKEGSTDERNFVKKAVNWALRQIGKHNLALNEAAIKTAREINEIDSQSARWIASDALRELTGEEVQQLLKARVTIIK